MGLFLGISLIRIILYFGPYEGPIFMEISVGYIAQESVELSAQCVRASKFSWSL